MHRKVYFGVVWLIVVFGLDLKVPDDLPCPFSDSINITNGILNADKSITYNSMNFPPDRYQPKVSNSTQKRIEKPTYGCLCDKEKCIPFCKNRDMEESLFTIKVLDKNNSHKEIDLRDDFKVVTKDLICPRIPFEVQITSVRIFSALDFNQQIKLEFSNCFSGGKCFVG